MLDFTNPWTFMEELDGWINFVYELQKRAGFSIVHLEEMADNGKILFMQLKNTSNSTKNLNSMKMVKSSNFLLIQKILRR